MPEVKLLPFQQVLLDDHTHFEQAIAGGYGSGKTHFGILWSYDRARLNPKSRSWIVSTDFDLLRNSILERMLVFLQEMGFAEGTHYNVNYSTSNLSIEYYWGHKTFLKSAGKRVIQAAEVSDIWFDEAGELTEQQIVDSMNRVRCPKANFRQVLFTGTPQGLGPFAKRFSDLENTSGLLRWNDKRICLHFPTYLNPYLPREYLAQRLDDYGGQEQLIQSWLLGRFTPLFEAACYRFDPAKHACEEYEPDPTLPLIVGADQNVGQCSYVAMQQWNGQTYMIKEAPKGMDTTDDAASNFMSQFPPKIWSNTEILIDGDASGWARDTRAYLDDYSIWLNRLRPHYPKVRIITPRANESVAIRILITNRAFEKGLVHIDKRLRHTIESFNSTTYDGAGKISKPSADVWTHWSDAATYPLVRLHPLNFQRFRAGAVTW